MKRTSKNAAQAGTRDAATNGADRTVIGRRSLLLAGTAEIVLSTVVGAEEIRGGGRLPNEQAILPQTVHAGGWQFFTQAEAAAVESIADTVIPADELSPGGKEVGCALFLDRRLAGPYGKGVGMYLSGPAGSAPTPQQGYQFDGSPAQLYRQMLATLDQGCRSKTNGKAFAQLDPKERNALLAAFEGGSDPFDPSSRALFDILLQDIVSGFFSDPVYGGNKDMAGWRMIGFPGARYDYRGFVTAYGKQYPNAFVDLAGNTRPAKGVQ